MNNSCLACGGIVAPPGTNSFGFSGKFCQCIKLKTSPDPINQPPIGQLKLELDPYFQVKIGLKDFDKRAIIALKAMEAIESSNIENSFQTTLTVEQVADRAVNMADAMIERLKR